MGLYEDLIPPPPTVREGLTASLRQARLLRRLLRLSITAAEERQRHSLASPTSSRRSPRDNSVVNTADQKIEAVGEASRTSGAATDSIAESRFVGQAGTDQPR